jgi:hypothetical protein
LALFGSAHNPDVSGALNPILRLQEQILAHPGKPIVDALQLLDDPVRLLLAPNAKHLDAHLATFPFDAAGNLVFDAMRRELMDDYLGEALRLMHNLVAAVGTVIDQTRIVLEANWPDPTNLVRVRFADALRRFRSDGRLLVVRDLRTYILHLRLPRVSGRRSPARDTVCVPSSRRSDARADEIEVFRNSANASRYASAGAVNGCDACFGW